MKMFLIIQPRVRALKFFLFFIALVAIIHLIKSVCKVKTLEKSIPLDNPVMKHINFFVPVNFRKKDWHDYKFIEMERKRKGIGEQGKAAQVLRKDHILQANMNDIYGLNSTISDKISLNRSLPDTRHAKCKNKLYLESLPSVSVIITFHDEHPKTLLRTIYSVMNRSPEKLIKEVILVDDASTIHELLNIKQNVAKYSPKVKLVRTKEHKGPIGAKLVGAIESSADVLIFLESHSEVNVNWLPPLIEPIAMNHRTVVCPVIDMIDNYTFEYKSEKECHRGGFNWKFDYIRLPILLKDKENMPEPYENPVLMGGHFAISRIFFWELGGYDPGLKVRGGEQYELSFKIWQCGGRMLTAPCSRVGHINRSPIFLRNGCGDFRNRNFRRVAEVWMDEFALYVDTRKSPYLRIKEGDISEQKALRIRLQCKPFKWFISQVAPDILLRYPPAYLGTGNIKVPEEVSDQNYCIQVNYNFQSIFLNYCYAFKKIEQEFFFSRYKEIRIQGRNWDLVNLDKTDPPLCWDTRDSKPRTKVILRECHGTGGKQNWWYNVGKKQIAQGNNNCLDWDVPSRAVYVNTCNDTSMTQQWEIGTFPEDY